MPLQTIFPRLTLNFTFGRKSWSEKYYYITGQVPDLQAAFTSPQVKGLLNARCQLLGEGVVVATMKNSVDGDRRLFATEPGPEPLTDGNVPYYNFQFVGNDTYDPNWAILLDGIDASSQYHNHIFLAGIPAAEAVEGGAGQEIIVPAYLKLLQNYQKQLIKNWGFRVQAQGADQQTFNIASVSYANGSITVTLVANQGGVLPAIGAVARVGRVVTTESKATNGLWTITAVAGGPPQTITLSSPNAVAGGVAEQNTGWIRQWKPAVVPYAQLFTGQLVSRKRGVGADAPRGRVRRARA
jgi:hypothetical protein